MVFLFFLIKYYKRTNNNFREIKKKRVSLNVFLSKCRIYNVSAVAYSGGWGGSPPKFYNIIWLIK